MKIEVKNFGKIKKGTIDLNKRVTVFVGYNNSGKTYMSQLLWGVNSLVSNKSHFEWGKYISNTILENGSLIITEEIIAETNNEINNIVNSNFLSDLFNVSEGYFNDATISLQYSKSFLEEIKKQSFKQFTLVPTQPNYNLETYTFSDYYLIEKKEGSLIITISNETFERPVTRIELSEFDTLSIFGASPETLYKYSITRMLQEALFGKEKNFLFLPANRVFYPSYYKYIYSVSKQEKDLINTRLNNNGAIESIRSLSKSPYTKAVDTLTEKIYALNNDQTVKNYYPDLLNDLKDIIGGDIIIKSVEGIAPLEFYLKLDNGTELDMYMSSSSVNQLTTLYLYLKFWAEERNNYLIIDEPEENLHPDNQIKLVNILMKFADSNNNKILITTHSPLITDHINNYANLSYLKEQNVDTAALVKESTSHMADVENIKHSEYGVYFFNGGVNHKGESIEEYSSGDYGVYFRDFQTAQNKVKDIADILKDNIYDILHPHA